MTQKIQNAIIAILKQTKENEDLICADTLDSELIEHLGIAYHGQSTLSINREQRITLAKKAVQLGVNFAEIVALLTWKDFEGFVASVLMENNYVCIESYRRRGSSLTRGMEIDVIGQRGRTIVAIDAKLWSIRAGKASALKKAAEKQKERTRELSFELNNLSKKMGRLPAGEYQFIPVIVTWLVEEVELHEGVPVVPIFKLNSFILDFDQYDDLIVSYSGHHHISSN